MNLNVEIYYRILKYPIVLTRRRPGAMKIVHHLKKYGTITSEAPISVTTEDMEKVFAALCLLQQKDSRKSIYIDKKTVIVKLLIYDIARLVNNRNYLHITESIRRVATISISYSNEKGGGITHLVHEAKWDTDTGEIEIVFNREFYEACIKQPLTLNFSIYISLSPTGKNLYLFLISNSSDVFKEETLIERSVIQASRSDKARAILVSALNELVNNSVIRGWSKEKKNREWLYTINRATSTAGGKLLPQQVENRPPKNPANQPPEPICTVLRK